ncbi:DNA translocase FtsK 4TM domain-containing protein, partial [Cytophagaceae bacterium AH-315-L13]|nr:DNA translocase FtsK 4TM domain-containing protein [Cytophagaceae bacterium AH-315-L13]
MYLFFNPSKTKVKTPLKSRREQKSSFISTTLKNEKFQQVSGLLLILVSLFLSFSFTSYLFTWKADQSIVSDPEFGLLLSTDTELTENKLGVLGALVSHFLINNWLGVSAYLFAFWSFLLGWRVIFKSYLLPWKKTLKYSAFLLCWCSITFGYFFHDSLSYLGGSFGFFISKWMSAIVGDIGVLLFITFSLASFLVTEFNFNKIGLLINSLIKKGKQEDIQPVIESENSFSQENGKPEIIELPTDGPDISNQGIPVLDVEPKPEESEDNKTIEFDTPVQPEDIIKPKPKSSEEISLAIEETTKEVEAKAETVASDNDSLYDPTLDLSNYKHPTLDLLEDYGNQRIEVATEELEMNKDKIIETLGHYKIGIDQIKATIGPTVTLYEIVPTAGVKISRIKNLEDDIALSLSALGIRIIAPIPGKGTIGIEVPNSK